MKISDITIGTRHRKSMGNIVALAASISNVGLLHPLVVNTSGELIVGGRRFAAVKMLGWEDVGAIVAESLDDVHKALLAERDENTCRLDFAPSEAVAMAKALEPFEKAAATDRKATSNAQRAEGGKFPPSEKGKARDKVADAVGLSAPTLAKARAVVDAAAEHPNVFGDIAREMDETGKVYPAYEKLAEKAAEPDSPEVKLPRKPRGKKAAPANPPAEETAPRPIATATVAVSTVDEAGNPLPDDGAVRAAFEARPQFQAAMNSLSQLKATAKKFGPGGLLLRMQEFEAHLTNARRMLVSAMPHAVCPYCGGKGISDRGGTTCTGCDGRKWVAIGTYNSAPSEMKARAAS